MTLFHATLNEDYAIGLVVTAAEQSSFYPLAVTALDQAKPAGAPSRAICLFAADDPEFAYLFAIKQQWPRDRIRLYEVVMNVFQRAPMAIVHATQRRLEKAGNIDALVLEYWSPTKPWKYFEYFGPQMTIVGQRVAPTINEILLSFNYQDDIAIAASM